MLLITRNDSKYSETAVCPDLFNSCLELLGTPWTTWPRDGEIKSWHNCFSMALIITNRDVIDIECFS